MCAYKCNDCEKEFGTKKGYTYHTNNNVCFSEKKEFYCKYCPGKFTSKTAMYKHIREVCKVKKQNDNEK